MAEQSPEVEQLLRDMFEAVAKSDIEAIARRTSREPGVVGIGSDPNEWAEGYDEIMAIWSESMPDADLGVRIGLDEVKGYREGSVGWATARGYFELEGKRVPVRMTAVVHEEDGDWKGVQSHASIGVPNDRMLDPMFQAGG